MSGIRSVAISAPTLILESLTEILFEHIGRTDASDDVELNEEMPYVSNFFAELVNIRRAGVLLPWLILQQIHCFVQFLHHVPGVLSQGCLCGGLVDAPPVVLVGHGITGGGSGYVDFPILFHLPQLMSEHGFDYVRNEFRSRLVGTQRGCPHLIELVGAVGPWNVSHLGSLSVVVILCTRCGPLPLSRRASRI